MKTPADFGRLINFGINDLGEVCINFSVENRDSLGVFSIELLLEELLTAKEWGVWSGLVGVMFVDKQLCCLWLLKRGPNDELLRVNGTVKPKNCNNK